MLGDGGQDHWKLLGFARCLLQCVYGCTGLEAGQTRHAGGGVQSQDVESMGRAVRMRGDQATHFGGFSTAEFSQGLTGSGRILCQQRLNRGVRIMGQVQGLRGRQVRRLRLLGGGLMLWGNLPGPLVQPLYAALGDVLGQSLELIQRVGPIPVVHSRSIR
ncbi:hypothetical protein Dalu01_01816 [Deinococcus aluminii]|uniref:Uncharacterized protein n=1 Tax=Deinococcus aluminii TaxID=1656885 RepID=A0ABP9XEW3_9DEIO